VTLKRHRGLTEQAAVVPIPLPRGLFDLGEVLGQRGPRLVTHADRLAVEQDVRPQVGFGVLDGFRLHGCQGLQRRFRGGGEGPVVIDTMLSSRST
jgi:hypothetical protein